MSGSIHKIESSTDIETQIQSELLLKDGVIMNATITQIDLLSRAKSPSYAEQNNLTPGIWINLTYSLHQCLSKEF